MRLSWPFDPMVRLNHEILPTLPVASDLVGSQLPQYPAKPREEAEKRPKQMISTQVCLPRWIYAMRCESND